MFDWQASAWEIPTNRGNPGISAGQRSRARTADRGWGDDHCSWKATAGVFTASHQQVSRQNKPANPISTGDESDTWSSGVPILTASLCSCFFLLFPSRLDSAENQVDETIFLLESYVNSTATSTSWESDVRASKPTEHSVFPLLFVYEYWQVWLFYSLYNNYIVSFWRGIKSE